MKTYFNYTSLAACVCFLLTLGARAGIPSTITTTDGQTYNGVSLVRIEPDGYLVNYKPQDNAVGMAKIKFSRLSADEQKQAKFNADKAREFENQVAKANEDCRQESFRLEQVGKAERQAQQARDAQDEQLAIQRMSALADLKMAEANLSAKNGDNSYGWASGGIGAGAVAIPEVVTGTYPDRANTKDFRTYLSALNRIPVTRPRPAYYSGKPILSPFTPSR